VRIAICISQIHYKYIVFPKTRISAASFIAVTGLNIDHSEVLVTDWPGYSRMQWSLFPRSPPSLSDVGLQLSGTRNVSDVDGYLVYVKVSVCAWGRGEGVFLNIVSATYVTSGN